MFPGICTCKQSTLGDLKKCSQIDEKFYLCSYKQIQVNVLGTIADLLFFGSPWDKGGWIINQTYSQTWSAGVTHAVYTYGTVNRPLDEGTNITFTALCN